MINYNYFSDVLYADEDNEFFANDVAEYTDNLIVDELHRMLHVEGNRDESRMEYVCEYVMDGVLQMLWEKYKHSFVYPNYESYERGMTQRKSFISNVAEWYNDIRPDYDLGPVHGVIGY